MNQKEFEIICDKEAEYWREISHLTRMINYKENKKTRRGAELGVF
jgi:hypothetical protein